MGEVEVKETSLKEVFKKFFPRVAKATIITAIVGACLLIFWSLVLEVFAWYPEYQMFFAILAWPTIFFTFAIRVTDGTILKFCFIVGRAFFQIIYTVYATNNGILTLDFMNFHVTLEFVPLLFLVILVNLITIGKGILQAIEFTSESLKE